jgi:hypothetical protein
VILSDFRWRLLRLAHRHGADPATEAPITLTPNMPPALSALINRLLAKRPDDRVQTAAEPGGCCGRSPEARAAMTSAIPHVSDTARWVAMYRALESERPDAIFRDPYARRLAGPEGEAMLRTIPKGLQLAWPMIVRTAVMDEIIVRVVVRDGVDTILNLAAGLDARPYRLPVPPSLRWIDADLPDMLDY